MKTFHLFFTVALLALTTARAEIRNLVPGLLVTEYPRHKEQTDGPHFFLEPREFGEPIGHLAVAKSVTPWRWTTERNAMARGYLVIDQDGDYEFTTNSFDDRNMLLIDGKVVCGYIDGGDRVVTVPLRKGMVEIACVGYVGSRGAAEVRWRTPWMRELQPIPLSHLKHDAPGPLADWVTVVARDFVIAAYKNGQPIPKRERQLLREGFGGCAERLNVTVEAGDWLVFQVACNPLVHPDSQAFWAAGCLDSGIQGFVSNPDTGDWCVCDDPGEAVVFIANREHGLGNAPSAVKQPHPESSRVMRELVGEGFDGKALWGGEASTWIKFVAPGPPARMVAEKPEPRIEPKMGSERGVLPMVKLEPSLEPQATTEVTELERKLLAESKAKIAELERQVTALKEVLEQQKPKQELAVLAPRTWRVQILSAIYGTGGKDADVTQAVKRLVEEECKALWAVNPRVLGADPNPGWNKGLHIVYMKDGVQREQHRGENEHVLVESFYGPQDAGELERWLGETRWAGPKGEIQFQKNGVLTGPGIGRQATWRALKKNSVEITWAKDETKVFAFDYVFSSFKDPNDGQNSYRILY